MHHKSFMITPESLKKKSRSLLALAGSERFDSVFLETSLSRQLWRIQRKKLKIIADLIEHLFKVVSRELSNVVIFDQPLALSAKCRDRHIELFICQATPFKTRDGSAIEQSEKLEGIELGRTPFPVHFDLGGNRHQGEIEL